MFLGLHILFWGSVFITLGIIALTGSKERALFIGKTILWGIFTLSLFLVFSILISICTSKKTLEKKDFYGEYSIDREFYSGSESDWQYQSFRFEITEKDKILFHITENERIIKTLTGDISTLTNYSSERLVILMDEKYHLFESNPTIFREPWGFYLVFNSSKYRNMFFRKNKWKKLN